MEILAIGIELFLQVFDKRVLAGVLLAAVPAFLWVFVNRTFAKKKGLDDLRKDGEQRIAKINRLFYELEDFVKTNITQLEHSTTNKVSKEEMHEYLDEFKEEVKDVEKQVQHVISSVGFLVQKNGGDLKDVLQLNKKEG